ncbi:MAG: Permease, MFS-type [Frankiales bacterium]|nr:Permease, MFS-type [Frankiales bacterium]
MTRPHRAWGVAAVTFVALVGAAGFRATPGVLIVPLQDEYGWSRSTISLAVSVNLLLFGVTAPFAAALMERFGIRRVVAVALTVVATGSALTTQMTQSWQLVACWGVLVGLGTGSMALVFGATVANRWFVKRRGLVLGILTAGSATGQLVFLPLLANLVDHHGWRSASWTVSIAALAVVPFVLILLRERPSDLGLLPYGATEELAPPAAPGSPAKAAIGALRMASRTGAFWLLAGGFAICGATTNGLIGTHFIPAAHDHGLPSTTAASLLALVGVFDIIGTIGSGWLTDRVDSRKLLWWYYALRGLSLFALPSLFASSLHPHMLVFVLFYGLDWVATVPPTVTLCRELYGDQGTLVFGWVFASHQIGAGVAATVAGIIRTSLGTYDLAWYGAGSLCLIAAALSLGVRAQPTRTRRPEPALAA